MHSYVAQENLLVISTDPRPRLSCRMVWGDPFWQVFPGQSFLTADTTENIKFLVLLTYMDGRQKKKYTVLHSELQYLTYIAKYFILASVKQYLSRRNKAWW